MISYGAGPQADEVEVMLFGPGFGEAIAVHVGEQNWVLVDSCMDPESNNPAAHTYLQQIGVAPDRIRAIIASHWHDDHVRGLSSLVAFYKDAELHFSSVFSNKEAEAFLAAYNGNAAPKLTRGTQELYNAVKGRASSYAVHQRSNIVEIPLSTHTVRVTAFSPTPAVVAGSMARFAGYMPSLMGSNSPIGHAPEFRPNVEAVAIHVDCGDIALLLGADLEEHPQRGWSAVCTDAWCASRRRASAYKVAHHGSASGDVADIWQTLLEKKPTAFLTPFNNGNQRLPTDSDRARIKELSSAVVITSGASRRPQMESEKVKRLSDICSGLTPINAGYGATRLRRRRNEAVWRIELFGAAERIN